MYLDALIETANGLSVEPIDMRTIIAEMPTELSVAQIQEMIIEPKPIKKDVPVGDIIFPVKSFQQWFSENYSQLQTRLKASEEALSAIEDGSTSQNSFFRSMEYSVGQKRLEALNRLRAESLVNFRDEDVGDIKVNLTLYQDDLKKAMTELEQHIVELARSKLSPSRLIDIESDISIKLDINRLLVLYFQNDVNQYKEETNLDDLQIKELHRLLIQYVETKTAEQQASRTIKLLNELEDAADENAKNILKLQIAQTMIAKNYLDAAKDTTLSVFQIQSDILLMQNQVETLEKLLMQRGDEAGDKVFSESIEKIIMGGGKSKVILPTLTQKKADGNNLVIVEVPRALLQTCYADLRGTSKSLFNQEAFIFNFNRSSDCSALALKQLHLNLLRAIQNKSYMVTTGEALQSLELKYFELLKSPPSPYDKEKIAEWSEAVKTLDQIMSLLRERGELIIDEAHDGLLLKNKLNYTVGEPKHLSIDIAHASVLFYKFIDLSSFEFAGIEGKVSFKDILVGKQKLTTEQFQSLSQNIADLILKSSNSPIKSIIDKFREKYKDRVAQENFYVIFKQYLLNQATDIPSFIASATSEEREIIALYKEELSSTLASTLNRKHLVHYGESRDPSLTTEEGVIAIPYRANKVPKYGSNFSNEIESINYTIQSMMLSGVDRDLFIKLLLQWREASKSEALFYQKSDDTTKIGALFKFISQESFTDLDVYNTATQKRLYEKLKDNKEVIFAVLETLVLGKIKLEKEVLHSDAYAHVDLVHSCQGITGTPWNSSTFHQRLQYDPKIALGTDGYVVSAIETKKPKLIGLDFDNTEDFIKQLFDNDTTRTRAIIDVSATFKGIENNVVATALSSYIDANQAKFSIKSKNIKYILFFNERDELSAMPVSAAARRIGPIVIGSSDPKIIQKKLKSTPEEIFTFYDQSHTVGADIKQEDDAKAIILTDQTTQLQNFLQGTMRMRGLVVRSQNIDVVMPTKMRESLKEKDEEAFFEFIDLIRANEQEQLKSDNFYAAIGKIHNTIRNDLCIRILTIDTNNPELKSKIFHKLESFFIELKATDLFSQFGDVVVKKRTSAILAELCEKTLMSWETLLQKAKDGITDEELKLIKENCNCSYPYDAACQTSMKNFYHNLLTRFLALNFVISQLCSKNGVKSSF